MLVCEVWKIPIQRTYSRPALGSTPSVCSARKRGRARNKGLAVSRAYAKCEQMSAAINKMHEREPDIVV